MSLVFSFLAAIGRGTFHIFEEVGTLTFFIISTIRSLFKSPFYFKEFLRSVVSIGYFSLPVIGLTALFTGGALALQIYSGGSRFNSESAVPAIVSIGMVRELGPVLCGLMIAGRVGSAIAAEIGTMKVSDQLDALVTLSTNPKQYLVIPRVAAATLVLPILTGVGDILGIMGGFLVGTLKLGFSSQTYLNQAVQFLETADVVSGLVKGAVFGFIVAIIGCYCGFRSGMGARGVGKATTQSVALSSILIIASNFILTEIFF
ncbi:MAG: ABC transporter permease [Rhodobacteraceae bacterium]|nr:ABC transporter permease [Paracoccaceae bacterium]